MARRYHVVPVRKLDAYADEHGLTLDIWERPLPDGDPHRYFALFQESAALEHGVEVPTVGQGPSIDEAIRDYARVISLRRLVIRGRGRRKRVVLDVPRLEV